MSYDYQTIENEFVRDPSTTLNGLAKKFGVASTTSLYRYAKKHNWYEKRARKCEKRIEREANRAEKWEIAQAEEWERLCTSIRETLASQWDKVRADRKASPTSVSALSKATKDARDMGVFGVTIQEKRMVADLQRIEKELTESKQGSGLDIIIEGGEEYVN